MCVVTFDWEENDAVEKFKNFDKNKSISWAVLELTDYCNLNCKWCFANAGAVKRPVHISIKDVKKIVNTLAEAGVSQITYSGGEPTLYPHLKEAVRVARNCDMVVHMNTNGYIFTESMASELKKAGLSQVQINIDSICPEKHNSVRGKEESFERAIKALNNARKIGITCVSQTVLTKENENEIVKIFKLARSFGLQRCRIWDMTPSPGCATKNAHLMPRDYLRVLQKTADFAYENYAKHVEIGDPMFMPHIKTKLKMSGGYCVSAAGMIIYISTKGDVYFCCTSRHKMYNMFEEVKKGNDITDSHKKGIKRYLEKFKEFGECQKCKYGNKCKGGCYTRRNFSENNKDYWCKKCNS